MKWLYIALVLIAGCVRPVPGPAPPPVPPVPIVEPITPAPLTVVVVKDNASLGQLPSSQVAALMSENIRGYCQTHCKFGSDGKTPEYRSYQWATDVSLQSEGVRAAFKTAVDDAKGSRVPWLVVNNGKTGFSGPYPATEAEVLTILQRYGGA
ncbi:MAG: hypothetical protein V4719_10165 [Planctomycetota bacterium]